MPSPNSVSANARSKLSDDQLGRISNHARAELKALFNKSPSLHDAGAVIDRLPKFITKELVSGKVLGRGQFGVVKELKGIRLKDKMDRGSTLTSSASSQERSLNNGKDDAGGSDNRDIGAPQRLDSGASLGSDSSRDRQFIAENCIRKGGNARYAVKTLSDGNSMDANTYYQAVKDLAYEVHFLSKIEHPNVIKMRAVADCDLCSPNFFVVMDRLYGTLEKKIVSWRKLYSRYTVTPKRQVFDPKGKKLYQFIDDRLAVGFDLAAGLGHIHKMGFVHRDLKAENIGFDVRGDVKIFDFGLAKELTKELRTENGLYKMTEKTGSMRYMAPEVYHGRPYDEKCDIYSLGMVLYQIMALERPFTNYTMNMFCKRVMVENHRPRISPSWPTGVRDVMASMWKARPIHDRPCADEVVNVMKKELATHRRGNDAGLDDAHVRRRSSFSLSRD